MSQNTYAKGWKRVLERADIPHVGTHGVRQRATTEIANSGVPVKVGMQLTAHKTVTQFMRYVHTEDDLVRAAADAVANRRTVRKVQRSTTSPRPAQSSTAPDCPYRKCHPCSRAAEDGDMLARNDRRIEADRMCPRVAVQVAPRRNSGARRPAPCLSAGRTTHPIAILRPTGGNPCR
jgi:integrase-like protein